MFPHQKSIEEKGDVAVQEERRLAYVAITRAKKRLFISFANNRKFFGSAKNDNNDWMPSLPSRFIDELDKKFLKINEVVEEKFNDFDFTQELSFNQSKKSPGWQRYQEEKNKEKVKSINYSNNLTKFKIGHTVTHETFGTGKVIHIDGNKVLINFKNAGEKKVIDKFLQKIDNE
jgi:DNA helicase-2/ATP-dependent DNA helicase PcrA